MSFIFNDKIDESLIRYYETYKNTLDTEDYVSPRTNAFVHRFIDKYFKKSLKRIPKEARKTLKRYKRLARQNGLSLEEFMELVNSEEEPSEEGEEIEVEAIDTPEEGDKPEETSEAGESAEEKAETPDVKNKLDK